MCYALCEACTEREKERGREGERENEREIGERECERRRAICTLFCFKKQLKDRYNHDKSNIQCKVSKGSPIKYFINLLYERAYNKIKKPTRNT